MVVLPPHQILVVIPHHLIWLVIGTLMRGPDPLFPMEVEPVIAVTSVGQLGQLERLAVIQKLLLRQQATLIQARLYMRPSVQL